ncbi:MAG: short-chain fatty acid transporter [Crocinitomicaceae bacterium]|nr:short-chain fatty acid transporter [Crocinitomicaceae bacterium]
MSFSSKFAKYFQMLLPSPFAIAVILTIITFVVALFATLPFNKSYFDYSIDLLGFWEAGLWDSGPGGLYFAFQMMFLLVLGHVLALSKPFTYLINGLTHYCTNTANSAFVVTLSTIIVSLFNWGLGLIFGAILARKIGEKFSASEKPINYPLIGAAAYVGLMVWHGGISGSAPLKASESGNLKSMVEGNANVNLSNIPDSIGFGDTIFSGMNISVMICLLFIIPAIFYWIGKKVQASKIDIELKPHKMWEEDKPTGAEKIDASLIFSIGFGSVLIIYAFLKAFYIPDQPSLDVINPNYINLILLGLALILHGNFRRFLHACEDAIKDTTGILIQFPLYFGIMGIMKSSGLVAITSEYFAQISTESSFPVFTFLSAGLINIFVPSGGGQWAVQGPILIETCQNLGISMEKSIMALSYGDQLTNMLQPFWALPLLGITRLKAKQIMPYTLILFLIGGCIFFINLLIF